MSASQALGFKAEGTVVPALRPGSALRGLGEAHPHPGMFPRGPWVSSTRLEALGGLGLL